VNRTLLCFSIAILATLATASSDPDGRRFTLFAKIIDPERNQRFIDRGDYVMDTKTGLLWQKDGTEAGKMNFYDAARYGARLNLGGLTGWRVPTREELAAIFPATDLPFRNTKYTEHPCCQGPHEWNSYWTSELDPRLPDYAFLYQWYNKGGANNCSASGNLVHVRCVRGPLGGK
jgi:hypothetical protein